MKWENVNLKDIALIKTGKLDSNAAVDNGIYPFFTCDPKTLKIDKWAYDTEAVLLAGNNASGNYTAKYYCGKFNAYQRTYIIESIEKKFVNVRFLCYALNQRLELLKRISSGSTTKFLTMRVLQQLQIPLPPLPTQRCIASILSAYDDLIENNRRQIKLLEEAAQRLYKEWFVNFRFPGHENVRIVDGVPEGWEKKNLNNCLTMHINGGWGKEQPKGKNTYKGRVIRGTDISDVKEGMFSNIPLRYHTENDISKRKLNTNDIILELSNGNINNVGRCLYVDNLIKKEAGNNAICASFCKLLRPLDKLHSIIIYWEIQDMNSSNRIVPFRKNGSNGINNFAFEKFLSHKFLIPSNDKFVKPFEGMMNEIENLRGQLILSIEARDRLLPKLMDGEIEV